MNALSLSNLAVWPALILGVLLWVLGVGLYYRRTVRAPGFLASTEPQRRRFKAVLLGAGSLGTGLILVGIAIGGGLLRFRMPGISIGGFSLAWLALLGVNLALYARYRRDSRATPLLLWNLGTLALLAVLVVGITASMPWQAIVGAIVAYIVLREFCYAQLKRRESNDEPKV